MNDRYKRVPDVWAKMSKRTKFHSANLKLRGSPYQEEPEYILIWNGSKMVKWYLNYNKEK